MRNIAIGLASAAILAALPSVAVAQIATSLPPPTPEFVRFSGYGWLPPARFDRPYRGHLRVIRADYWTIRRRCGGRADACVTTRSGRCTIYIPVVDRSINVDAAFVDRLRRHEIGHCNGWSERHADARP